jgi:hypothetical protein
MSSRYKKNLRLVFLVILLAALASAACNETKVEVVDPPVDVDTDDSLPDGFVTGDRPPNPQTSFKMPCPLREVESPEGNTFFIPTGIPDGIRSIDNPKWVSVQKPTRLTPNEPVVVCEYDDQVRVFPIRILLYHEIVNLCWETDAGPKYSFLTYCPLVDAAVHFVHPYECYRTKGQTFGVSGALFNGNLVMYDRTGTSRGGARDWYVQLYGGGVFGTCTEVEPQITHMSWAMVRRLYPEAELLSEDTGIVPAEGYEFFDHVYSYHWRVGDFWFPLDLDDNRGIGLMKTVFGVVTPDGTKAYWTQGTDYVQNETLGSHDVVVWNDSKFKCSAAFEPLVDGQKLTFSFLGRESHGLPLYVDDETGSYWTFDGIAVEGPLAGKRLPKAYGFRVFWFAWAALYPETEIFVPE